MKLHGVPNQLNMRTAPGKAPVHDENVPISGFLIVSPRMTFMKTTLGHDGSRGNHNQMDAK
jgi:hypothetical protein